ncbi:MAG: hypothetical protein HDS37_04780 [Bacteroides sp.]|nr:hypothetical protein [Bacteroides sp.]
MGNSRFFLAPLSLAVIGALFGIGHFGGLHETFFGSDNKSEIVTTSYYNETYSPSSYEYGHEITFRGKNVRDLLGVTVQGLYPPQMAMNGRNPSVRTAAIRNPVTNNPS